MPFYSYSGLYYIVTPKPPLLQRLMLHFGYGIQCQKPLRKELADYIQQSVKLPELLTE
jgi:hypothetical protein